MKSSPYEPGDVFRIARNGQEVLARLAGYTDSLDETQPLFVNLRTIDDIQWKRSVVKIRPEQIVELLPTWEEDRRATYEAEQKVFCAELLAKMTSYEKARMHQECIRLGISQPDTRSPLDRMIDKACGIE